MGISLLKIHLTLLEINWLVSEEMGSYTTEATPARRLLQACTIDKKHYPILLLLTKKVREHGAERIQTLLSYLWDTQVI